MSTTTNRRQVPASSAADTDTIAPPIAPHVVKLAHIDRVPGCTEPIDLLTARTKQLEALLMLMHGAEGDALQDLSGELQTNAIWLACSLSNEVNELARLVARGGGKP
ncbi:MAG: hypothetical protein RIQ60_2609 [Pseudomonadota bacterium]|jgi:hypothetical protein